MSSWSRVQLASIAESVDYGVTASAAFSSVGPKFLRITDIQDDNVDWSNVPWCSCGAKELQASRLKAGDIVFARTGATTGKSYLIDNCPTDSVFASYLIRVRMKKDVEPRFISHFFKTEDYWAQISKGARGAAQPGVNATTLKSLEVPLPPLPEQRRIADILGKAEALRAKRRETLAQFDKLAQSVFIEMFGDPAANPKGWSDSEMAALFDTSPIFGTMIPPTPDGGDWLSLRVANIQDWRLDLSDQKYVTLPANTIERHSVKDGDLLLARAIASQEHLGKAVVAVPAGRKWAFDSHLMRLRFNPERALPEFIRHLWMTPGGRSLFLKATRRSAVQFNINTKEMNSLRLPIPPIELQRKFVCRVKVLNSLRNKRQAALIEMDSLFSALQHRAFRGEL